MKHRFVNLRDELDRMYKEYDSFAIYRMVYDEVDRFNQHFYDNFFALNRDNPAKKRDRTEYDLIESFWLRYEFSLLSKKLGHTPVEDDGLPLPRTLFGQRTSLPFAELSHKEDRLYKHNLNMQKENGGEEDPVLHMTTEFVEKNTNIRFARTYFLHNLSEHYMQGYSFSDDPEEQAKLNSNEHEMNVKVLLKAYTALLFTF